MSMCSLEDENKDLRFEIEQQLGIIESQKQDLHDAQRKIDCLSHMKVEMEIEIEALTGLQQINGNLETKVKTLETELNSTRLRCEKLETELRSEKENHEKAIVDLNTELTNLKNKHVEEPDSEKTDELITKLNSSKDANSALMNQNLLLQCEQKSLCEKNVLLELTLNEKDREMEEMKNILETKTNDLQSALKLVDELQEEKAAITCELQSIKTRPAAEDRRGNSLFAEVDDKRQSVAQKLDAMHKKYKELKKSFIKKNTELRALEAENIELKKKFEANEIAPYESMASLLDSHKMRIQDLTHRISVLEKRPESPQIISISEITSSTYDSIKMLIDNESANNIDRLERALCTSSITLSRDMFDVLKFIFVILIFFWTLIVINGPEVPLPLFTYGKAYRELVQEMEERSLRELLQGEELFKLKQEVRMLSARRLKDEAKISELMLKLDISLQKNKI